MINIIQNFTQKEQLILHICEGYHDNFNYLKVLDQPLCKSVHLNLSSLCPSSEDYGQ